MTDIADIAEINFDLQRACGGCTLCCKLVPVEEIGKQAGVKCQHQQVSGAKAGCKVYHKASFPISCAFWSCRWLQGDKLPRPDHCHFVVDIMPTTLAMTNNDTGEEFTEAAIQVWVDPAHRSAAQNPALLAYIESHKMLALLRFNSGGDAITLWPPSRTMDGKWYTVDSNLLVHKTQKDFNKVLTDFEQRRAERGEKGEL